MHVRSEAKRSNVPYDHLSVLLHSEESEATEPYNKFAKHFVTFFVSQTFRRKITSVLVLFNCFQLFFELESNWPDFQVIWIKHMRPNASSRN